MTPEYANSGWVHPEVMADFAALKAADPRGELRAHRAQGHQYFRVLREKGGRRVVPADRGNGRVDSRRTPAERLAEFDNDHREQRLARAEVECAPVLRRRRLERLEGEVYHAVVERIGGSVLRPVYGGRR